MDAEGVLQGGVEVLQLCGVDGEGPGHLLVKVRVDGMVKVARVLPSVVVHEELFGQNVPGSISVKVLVPLHELCDDVNMDAGVEVFQFLISLCEVRSVEVNLLPWRARDGPRQRSGSGTE